MDISCAFPPSPDTPGHIALAESLGYRRAWVYDQPAPQHDAWMTLALAAERTNRIELGPGIIIPSLRHVLITASAIATLVLLAPGRVNIGFCSGYARRQAMGQLSNRWSFVADYMRQLRGLLNGKTIEVEGAPVSMLYGSNQTETPIQVPFVVGTGGLKGEAVVRDLGNGILTFMPTDGFRYSSLLTFGQVLSANESFDSPRLIEAAGTGAVVWLQATWEQGDLPGRSGLDEFPGGEHAQAAIEANLVYERHLSAHEGHPAYPNEMDQKAISGDLIRRFTFTGAVASLRKRLNQLITMGVTEVAYQPEGSDIQRELEEFARMAKIDRIC